jgi:hypothetical protein
MSTLIEYPVSTRFGTMIEPKPRSTPWVPREYPPLRRYGDPNHKRKLSEDRVPWVNQVLRVSTPVSTA